MGTTTTAAADLALESVRRELEARREEYAKLLAEYDEVTGTLRRHLETEYMMRIGRLEYRLFALQLQVRQLKREIALYQAAKNRREIISDMEVKRIIEEEFAEYRTALAEHQEKIRRAETHHFAPKLSVAATRALRTLYHDMVRKLHPDLNRNLPEKAGELWIKIVAAHKNCDWQELNILADMVYDLLDGGRPAAETPNCLEQLLAEEQRIAAKSAEVKERLRKLQERPPYSYRALLGNDRAVNDKRRELLEALRRTKEYLAELGGLRDELRRGTDAEL